MGAANGGYITEWYYHVAMAVTDASQRGHFKVQTTELLAPDGDFHGNDVSQAASISYYSTMNANIVGGSMQ
ncbi:MAG TPA: hypothetical protein DCM40_25825, partial [Maribacter sp.]|nr:hypothetical protein [Maribacter sp.]